MKNLHFCTLDKINEIKNAIPGTKIKTHRTGFVPMIYSGDIINLNQRIGKEDIFLKTARIEYIFPVEYQEISDKDLKEINESYDKNRRWHIKHWFFLIGLIIIENSFK